MSRKTVLSLLYRINFKAPDTVNIQVKHGKHVLHLIDSQNFFVLRFKQKFRYLQFKSVLGVTELSLKTKAYSLRQPSFHHTVLVIKTESLMAECKTVSYINVKQSAKYQIASLKNDMRRVQVATTRQRFANPQILCIDFSIMTLYTIYDLHLKAYTRVENSCN